MSLADELSLLTLRSVKVDLFDTILAFAVSWYAVGSLIVLAIWSQIDNEESGWVAFWSICILYVCYTNVSVTIEQLLIGIPVYLIIGIAWSIWRYMSYTKKYMLNKHTEYQHLIKEQPEKYNNIIDEAAKRISPSYKVAMISHHILLWPISVIYNMFSDVIAIISSFIRTHMIGIYHRILSSEVTKYKIER